MRNRTYTDQDKQQARRLLIIHSGDVGIVHQLTSIPKRTLYEWRATWDDQYDLFYEAFAQKIVAYADANKPALAHQNPTTANDADSAQPTDSFAQFTQLREILMEHIMTLANNLLIGDNYINHRVIALSRLIDRIIQLDNILPDQNPEKVIRIEYFYDGVVQDNPPWKGASNETDDETPYPYTP